MALFDTSLCVPVTHWGSAVAKAPSASISVAWSSRRPCVFFVKCGEDLDVWDLADKAHIPIQTVDLSAGSAPPPPPPPGSGSRVSTPGSCSELFVGSDGLPIVSNGGTAMVLGLPTSLTNPLQTIPRSHGVIDRTLDELIKPGYEKAQAFPTLTKFSKSVEVPKHALIERDLLRRILAGIHPMQAWV